MDVKKFNDDKVIGLILGFADSQSNVRAVMLNGSRVNPNAPSDIMQDYDVVFFVDDYEDNDYREDWSWVYQQFGDPVIIQQNDSKDNSSYVFLMQFNDFRIDLSFMPIERMNSFAKEDSLSLWLMDKDNITPELPEPNESTYWVQKPSKKTFEATLNEAWWIQPYIAKGIWRNEFPYVRRVYDVYLMNAIRSLVNWDIGSRYNWQVNPGKAGKWYEKYLDKKDYIEFVELNSTRDYEDIWESLYKAGNFIRKIGSRVAVKLDYEYPYLDDERVRVYLSKIREQVNK